MGMQQQFSKTTDPQEYWEEDYKNFIQSCYPVETKKSEKFFQVFINFINNKSFSDQAIIFTQFAHTLTAPETAYDFIKLLPMIQSELLALPLKTVAVGSLITFLKGLKKKNRNATCAKYMLNVFKNQIKETPHNLTQACAELLKQINKEDNIYSIILRSYISACTFLELKPSKEILQETATSTLLAAELTDELIIERAREIQGVQEYNQVLEDAKLILHSNTQLLCIEINSIKIKKNITKYFLF